jgi:DNA-binding IclR family transcriptional regulator
MNRKLQYSAPAVEKCLDVLEYLSCQQVPKNQKEIANAVNRSPNEIYRVLTSLEARGYIVREVSGSYRVSLKLYNLSRSIYPIEQIRRIAMPFMDEFSFKFGVSCYLCMLYQSQTMVIIHARGSLPVSLNLAEGALLSTVNTASGNVLLANSHPSVQNMLYARSSDYRSMNEREQATLREKVNQISTEGYTKKIGAFGEGVYSFATLIGNSENAIIASLGMSYLNDKTHSTNVENSLKEKDLIQGLLKTANKINSLL